MIQTDLFTPVTGETRKAHGIAQVWEHAVPWGDQALAVIDQVPRDWVGLFEELRPRVLDAIGAPHHPNAWGALTRSCRLRRLLYPTGEWRQSQAVLSNNARTAPVYRRSER
jgi:hypothetical protein